MGANPDEPLVESFEAAAFAEFFALRCERRGKPVKDLFVALAGLICAISPKLGAQRLEALDEATNPAAPLGR